MVKRAPHTIFILVVALLMLCASSCTHETPVSSASSQTSLSSSSATEKTTMPQSNNSSDSSVDTSEAPDSEAVKVCSLFGDHMVLQRRASVPVFGTGTDGETVTVQFNGQTLTTTVADGKWRVNLSAMEADSNGKTMTITAGDGTVTEIEDILVGEVWLCSGQSNMEMSVASLLRQQRNELKEYAANPLVRTYFHTPTTSRKPLADVERFPWIISDGSSDVEGQSAYALGFAACLCKELNVPVGVVTMSHGGTQISMWLDTTAGSTDYNGMMAPITPFRFAGLLWYQGEADASINSFYAKSFAYFCELYRRVFEFPEMPIIAAQIANFENGTDTAGYPDMKCVQAKLMENNDNMYTVCAADFGEKNNIHPNDKLPYACRAAELALNKVYGILSCPGISPSFASASVSGKSVIVKFRNVSDKLVLTSGDSVAGLYVAGADGDFKECRAVITGKDEITVDCSGVSSPRQIHYQYVAAGAPNLYDANGLPVFCFNEEIN